MKNIIKVTLCVLVVLTITGTAEAQIRIGLKLDNQTVLQHEKIKAFISVYNDTPKTIVINDEYGDFKLEPFLLNGRKEPVSVIKKSSICGELLVRPGEKEVVMIDISNWYDFSREGQYDLEIHGIWKKHRFRSNTMNINVVGGFELASIDKNLSGHVDKVRHYSLRYWKRGTAEHLFLRVEEPANQINYGVYDLGRVIRFFKPVLKVDANDNIKIIHQVSRDCYKKTLFRSTPTGIAFVDQSYHLESGAPYPHLKNVKVE